MMDQGDADRLADDISRKYPYPLAATYWRAFYAAANADESHEYLLDLYEITLKYCAAIAVSQYIADGVNDAKINQDLQHLQRPSLGHWQGWLRDILMLYHRTKRHLVVPELATFYQRSDAAGLLQAYQTLQKQVEDRSAISKVTPRQFFELLGAYRNRLAHGARPSSDAKERVANVLVPAMRELFRQLSFLAEYRLVYLSKVTVEFDERQSEPLRYAYAHSLTYLTGDSPRVSAVPVVLSQAWRDKKLYLLDKGGGFQPLLSLHPLLIFRPCERCNRHQAFVLNATKDRALDYLSYQCTHHFNPTEYVDDVRLLLEGLTATTERDRPQPSSGADAMPLATGQDTRDKEPTVARESKRERQAGRHILRRKSSPSAAIPAQTTHETPESTPAPVAGRAPEPREQHASLAPPAEPTSEPMVRDASVVPPVMSSPPERRLAHGGQRAHRPAGEALRSLRSPRPGAAHRPSALPVPPTPLIGRAQEVAAVRQRLLEPATRLLTLTGAGGTGKTRLAVQVAAEVLDVFPDGVYFVNLAPLSDPLLVLPTIARTLGMREAGGQPLRDILYSFLHQKQLLLVLDNFEQVLEAAPEVADLLAVCADVRVLVTSRAALHLRGEHRYDVPPLALPELWPPPPLERLMQNEAVRLFIARARDVKPNFAVTSETAPAVAEICVRLDGLPLAIELAAARVRLFTPPALLARLSNRLGVLTGGARDLPARQRTLRATIDWSYSLLAASEQVLFARLGVFVGGATLEAIEAVCNPDGELDVLEGVESLLEKNLLRQMGAEEPRFVMLETIHEYARERMKEALTSACGGDEGGEADVLRRQHVAYYLAMAEQAEAGLHGPEQGEWLVRLEDEHDNVRAALAWCLDVGEYRIAGPGAAPAERTAAGVRLAGALWWFWYLHAHRREGLHWLEKALSQSTGAPASRRDPAPGEWAEAAMRAGGRRAPADPRAARAKVALGAARIAWEQHQSEQGKKSAPWCQARLEDSVALYREAGDRYGVADALSTFGLLARRQAGKDRRFGVDPERGTALLEESLTLAREVGDPWLIACILERLASTADLQRDAERARARAQAEESLRLFQEVGDTLEIAIVQRVLGQIALYERDYARARAAFSMDLATTRALGDKIGIAVGLTNLGDVAREEGDLTAAAALYEESLALWRDLGSVDWGIPWALLGLGDLCLQRGDHAAARSCFAESLRLARQENQIVASLEALAGLAATQGQPARALRLAAAAAALRDRIGEQPWPANQAALTRRLAAAREALSAEGQAAAWADGQALTVEQAAAEALGKAQDG